MFPPKVHLIKNKSSFIGATTHSKRYVLGFFHKRTADIVKRNIDLTKDVRVVPSTPENIAADVNFGLKELGVDQEVPTQLVIDVGASLYIPIGKSQEMYYGMNLVEEDTESFLMWPFDKYLGVILPLNEDFVEEDEHLKFTCQMIDPSIDIERFRKSLAL